MQRPAQRGQHAEEIGRHAGHLQTQKVLDLRQRNQHRDAVGKADHHGNGNEADQRAELEQAHQKQHDARHRGGDDQVGQAVALHDAVDDDDEGAGRPADLHRTAAEQRDQEAGDDGGEDAGLGLEAGRDRKGHGQRQAPPHPRSGRRPHRG